MRIAIGLILCLSAGAAAADNRRIAWAKAHIEVIKACYETEEVYNGHMSGITFYMVACLQAKLNLADVELNDAWNLAKEQADNGGYGSELLEVQRKWIALRDAACSSESITGDPMGSLSRIIGVGCFLEMTERRTQELQDLPAPLDSDW